MLNTQSIKSFTDLRLNPALITQQATDFGPVYILNRNKPVSVLMDVLEYENIMDELKDSRDSLWLKKNEVKFRKAKGITSQNLRQKYNLNS